ncbi:DsbA family protein [Variovorax saccharolyticus]|uniref:DsbA family protein n=1 Tax=Variovorax saccharolyticus TaxID=3053516 RepID=UPI002576D391|nr:DsbA family protein [Variovorax sp. J22R187]MDM0016504.1 DsbA family protein [Variovorax sp. J22R187]
MPETNPLPPRTTLHYVFDPLCGWCYAAAPLIEAARRLPALAIEFHGGGMLTGSNRRPVTPQWRDYVMPHDRRIAELSGQPFGAAYFDGLLNDSGAVLDSAPPLTAVLAAEAEASRGLDMIRRVQHAHYVEGRRIAEPAVLRALATELGLDGAAFSKAFDFMAGEPTRRHIDDSRRWLARIGGQGFPTLALATADGRLTPLDAGRHLGRPDAWVAQIDALLTQALSPTSSTSPKERP